MPKRSSSCSAVSYGWGGDFFGFCVGSSANKSSSSFPFSSSSSSLKSESSSLSSFSPPFPVPFCPFYTFTGLSPPPNRSKSSSSDSSYFSGAFYGAGSFALPCFFRSLGTFLAFFSSCFSGAVSPFFGGSCPGPGARDFSLSDFPCLNLEKEKAAFLCLTVS